MTHENQNDTSQQNRLPPTQHHRTIKPPPRQSRTKQTSRGLAQFPARNPKTPRRGIRRKSHQRPESLRLEENLLRPLAAPPNRPPVHRRFSPRRSRPGHARQNERKTTPLAPTPLRRRCQQTSSSIRQPRARAPSPGRSLQ